MISLKAVLFDLDGTLRHNEPDGFVVFSGYLKALGCSFTPEQLARAERWQHYYWSIAPELRSDIETWGADTPAFWRRFAERQVAAFDLAGAAAAALGQQVNDLFQKHYQPVDRVDAQARPLLERLRAAGYTVGLVSNRSLPLEPVAEELGLSDLFHFTLAAGQVGVWKPAPEIFLRAVALAGCAPGEALYVGDNYYADIEGARGAGLGAVLIDPRGLFPDPGCPVIRDLGELPAWLPAP